MTAADEDDALVTRRVETHDCSTPQQLFTMLGPRLDPRAETLVLALMPQLDAAGEVVGINAQAGWTTQVGITSLRLMAEIVNDIADRIETAQGGKPDAATTH